ncbi:MAG: arsenate reductase ArsC [Nitrospirota bacterium]
MTGDAQNGERREKKRVLFLCTGNSCRSQMAEGLLRHLAGDRFEVASAGTRPAGLNPGAVEVMREIGLDIAHHRSKGIEEFQGETFAYVVTVCDRARESCPVFPGAATVLHWSFDDPAAAQGTEEERRAVFRRVRDEIASRIERFVEATAGGTRAGTRRRGP